jgi:uncharacterized protein GlcG (DUF336 family)
MTHPVRAGLGARLLAVCAMALGLLAVLAPAASASATVTSSTGWLRLANLSPGAPTFDIYLDPVGNMQATLVLRDISYGMVSGYQTVAAGGYTVTMRMAGKPASSSPVLSQTISVRAGHAYTIASMGPSTAPRLELLNDMLTTPKGKALVRVIQASLHQSQVTVAAGGHVLVRDLAFGSATSYGAVRPGTWKLHATGQTTTAASQKSLMAGTSYTLVVLDGTGHLELVCLMDGAGSRADPAGGAAMGFGGTAPRVLSPLPWLAGIAGGLLLAASGALWLRRTRPAA